MKHERQALWAMRAGVRASVWALVSTTAFAQSGEVASKLEPDPFTVREEWSLPRMIQSNDGGVSPIRNAGAKEWPKDAPQASSWGVGAGKSYLIPALEIPAF